ncbi:MAG: hypothetical protein HY700_11260 [Gemmatimonadetes bacterium]|nr:hypothetical protein [Gemmatimonadota bacterium]
MLKPSTSLAALFLLLAGQACSPATPSRKTGGSPNVHKLSNIPLGGYFYVGGIEIEQELSRPYVYVPRWRDKSGFVIIDVSDPAKAHLIYSWQIDRAAEHTIGRGETGKYFKTGGRYYYAKATVFGADGPDHDLGAIVFDLTGLPDTSTIREAGRIRAADIPDGFISVFPYKHSDGRVLLFGAQRTSPPGDPPHAKVYDMQKFLAGARDQGLVGKVPIPEIPLKEVRSAYHDVYVAYDPGTKQDKFYGGGTGGFFIYDVTKPESPRLLTSITNISGVQRGHTIIASPDGKYALTQMEYQFSPLMIFDLRPGLEGKVATISRPVGAWMADWHDLSHNHEVRWPYVFAAAYEDGLQVIDVSDPANPKTLGWYYTCECEHQTGFSDGQLRGNSVHSGAMEVDVRNADGLVVLSDLNTGFWAFRMDGFTGWNGGKFGVPDVSSVQRW